MPSAPLCDDSARPPGGGKIGENDPFIGASASALSTPMQFGPTMRMPALRTAATN